MYQKKNWTNAITLNALRKLFLGFVFPFCNGELIGKDEDLNCFGNCAVHNIWGGDHTVNITLFSSCTSEIVASINVRVHLKKQCILNLMLESLLKLIATSICILALHILHIFQGNHLPHALYIPEVDQIDYSFECIQ